MNRLFFLSIIIALLTSNLFANIDRSAIDDKTLQVKAEFTVASGITEYLTLKTRVGLAEDTELIIRLPKIFSHDNTGNHFLENPEIGFTHNILTKRNLLSGYVLFKLPFKDPRGLDINPGVTYSLHSMKMLDLITPFVRLGIPYKRISPTNFFSISLIPGVEFESNKFTSQFYLEIREDIVPSSVRKFIFNMTLHGEYKTGYGIPHLAATVSYLPDIAWAFEFGYKYIFDL